jgi:hypothetical protein
MRRTRPGGRVTGRGRAGRSGARRHAARPRRRAHRRSASRPERISPYRRSGSGVTVRPPVSALSSAPAPSTAAPITAPALARKKRMSRRRSRYSAVASPRIRFPGMSAASLPTRASPAAAPRARSAPREVTIVSFPQWPGSGEATVTWKRTKATVTTTTKMGATVAAMSHKCLRPISARCRLHSTGTSTAHSTAWTARRASQSCQRGSPSLFQSSGFQLRHLGMSPTHVPVASHRTSASPKSTAATTAIPSTAMATTANVWRAGRDRRASTPRSARRSRWATGTGADAKRCPRQRSTRV